MLENLSVDTMKEVSEREKFGWKSAGTNTEHRRSGRTSHYSTVYVLVRDTTMKNYALIRSLESRYFSLEKSKKRYENADILLAIVLFLLFIIPGIVYTTIKITQKHNIEEYNFGVEKKMKDILKELEKYK